MKIINANRLKESFRWSEVSRLSITEILKFIDNEPYVTLEDILNIIHRTIYHFFEVIEQDQPLSDKEKLLLEVNKQICINLKELLSRIGDKS